MVEWMKQHPLLTGTGIIALVVLFIVVRRAGSSAASAGGPSDALQIATLQAQAGQSQLEAASNAHTADLNAALQAKTIDAQTAALLAKFSITAQQNQSATDLAKTQATISGATDLATIQGAYQLSAVNADAASAIEINRQNTSADVTKTQLTTSSADTIASIQAQVAKEGYANALAMDKINTVAAVTIASGQTQRDIQLSHDSLTQAITLGAYKATTDAAKIQADLIATQDTNATALGVTKITASRDIDIAKILSDNAITLAGISAGVEQAKITATEDVYNHFLDTQSADTLAAISAHAQEAGYTASVEQSIVDLVKSGQINKGGEGGRNQVAVIAALTGQPQIGSAAEAPQPSIWQSFFAGLGSGIGSAVTHP